MQKKKTVNDFQSIKSSHEIDGRRPGRRNGVTVVTWGSFSGHCGIFTEIELKKI